jgi:hypothetical protein
MAIVQDMFSKVGDDDCSKHVFKGGSTQGWREEKVLKTCAKPHKEG